VTTSSSEPLRRRHHFLPASYLAGFTDSGNARDHLHVFDLRTRKIRRAKPSSVAYEKDLYRLDLPGFRPDWVEKDVWARFEGQIAPASVIRKAIQDRALSGKDWAALLMFAAAVAARLPEAQDAYVLELEQRAGVPFERAVLDEKHWEAIFRWCEKREVAWNETALGRIPRDPNCVNTYRQLWCFLCTMLAQDTKYELFKLRNWSLYCSPSDHEFICSDSPFDIIYFPGRLGAGVPRLDEKDTIVTFPLHKRAALVGAFSGGDSISVVDEKRVALVNLGTVSNAHRFLYGPCEDFVVARPGGSTGGAAYVFEHLGRSS